MTSKRVLITLLVTLGIICSITAIKTKEKPEEKDFAVPAMSDFLVLGGTRITVHDLSNPGPIPELQKMRWFDINRDFKLNDFDVKQFEAILEQLGPEASTGPELIEKFKTEQKLRNAASFPLLYDLDRDGKFTLYDVEYLAGLIKEIDRPGMNMTQMKEKFRTKVFPPDAASSGTASH